MPVIVAPLPLRVMLPCVGGDGRAAGELQGGAVQGVPGAAGERAAGDLGDGIGVEDRVPESASMVPVLLSAPLMYSCEVPLPASCESMPAFTTRGRPAIGIVDAGIGLDQVGGPRLDLQRGGGDVVAVQAEVAAAGLDDGPEVVERAVL